MYVDLQTQMNANFLKMRSAKMAFVSTPMVGMSVTARPDSTMMRANCSVLVRSKITICMQFLLCFKKERKSNMFKVT